MGWLVAYGLCITNTKIKLDCTISKAMEPLVSNLTVAPNCYYYDYYDYYCYYYYYCCYYC